MKTKPYKLPKARQLPARKLPARRKSRRVGGKVGKSLSHAYARDAKASPVRVRVRDGVRVR